MKASRPNADDRRDGGGFVAALEDYLEVMSPEQQKRLERALADDREHGVELSPEERASLDASSSDEDRSP